MSTALMPYPAARADEARWVLPVLSLSSLSTLLFLLYGNWLVRITPADLKHLWAVLGPLAIVTDFANPVYASPWHVGIAVYLCLAVTAVAWWIGRPGRIARSLMGLGVLLVMIFPFWLPHAYASYRLYAEAVPGYALRWLTPPTSPLSSAFKEAQRAHEKAGCAYSLRGWREDNVLYYASGCLPGYWRYDPAVGDEPTWVWRLSGVLVGPVDGGQQLGGGFRYPDRPDELGGKVMWYLVYQVGRSPNGRWLAAAVRNYYGPSDVVVVGAEGAVP